MKIVIVFHSVCGHTYLMARHLAGEFKALGHETVLRRCRDEDWVEKPDVPPDARLLLAQMRAVPEAVWQDLAGADLVMLGSPVYFGNVSAEMKAFMDSTGGLWVKSSLAGRRFAAFASAGGAEGGADLCLQALVVYAQYMGMQVVSLPTGIVKGRGALALGATGYPSVAYATGLDAEIAGTLTGFARYLSGGKL